MTPLPNNSVAMADPPATHKCPSPGTQDVTLNLFNECDRLRTFTNWSAPTNKRELAAAGFYYVNYVNKGDLVKCPYCNLEISRWEEGANPFDVHGRKSPHCNYIQQLKSRNENPPPSYSIPPFDARGAFYENAKSSIYELSRKARELNITNGMLFNVHRRNSAHCNYMRNESPPPSNSILPRERLLNTTETPSFPNYASKENRLKSYDKWPQSFRLQPEILSEAGFIYAGTEVKTICFQCGGGLSWDEHDDPFEEHTRWFPECHYIKSYTLRKSAAEDLATKKASVYACTPRCPASPARNHSANLNLSLESDRLKTFESWPVPFVSKNELAAAGFYYTKNDDRVICFYCNVEVGNWVMGDDPATEHLKHSPNCRLSSYCIMMLERKGASGAQTSSNSPVDGGYDTCGLFDLPNRRPTAYPQYSTFDSRMNSFVNWPTSAKTQPSALWEAGFFYAGIDDRTICYQCGGGLKDWKEQDEPWIEHAYWFPHCDYVLTKKCSAFIHEAWRKRRETMVLTQEEIKAAVEMLNNPPDVNMGNVNENKGCANVQDVAPGGSSDESQDDEKTKTLCKICYSQDRNTLFFPCGHMTCSKCANKIVKCAFCRGSILHRVQMRDS